MENLSIKVKSVAKFVLTFLPNSLQGCLAGGEAAGMAMPVCWSRLKYLTFGADSHDAQPMKPTDFDSMTFPLVPPSWHFLNILTHF